VVAHDLRRLVDERGWITCAELLREVSRGTVRTWVATGRLIRLAPGVLALPDAAGDWRVRVAASLHGREAVASHTTALALWELVGHPPGPVHLGRAELAELVDLLAVGCRSELEIWGCLHVLRAQGMPAFVQQRPVTVGVETFVLDAAARSRCWPSRWTVRLARIVGPTGVRHPA
jgi:hypothetical protein